MTDSKFDGYQSEYYSISYKDMEKVYISQKRQEKIVRYIFSTILLISIVIFSVSQNILNANWMGYSVYFCVTFIAMIFITRFTDIIFGKLVAKTQKKSIGLNIKQKIISKDGGFDVHNDRGISTFFYSDFKKYYILEDLTWLKLHGNLLLVAKHDAFDSLNLENFIKSIKANIKS